MKMRDIFSYAFSAIKLRKLRASLTTLGIVIGISAIVALLSLGQGFQDLMTAQFQKGFATNTLIVSQRSFEGTESGYQLFVNDTQTIEDIENVNVATVVIQKMCYINTSEGAFQANIVGVDFADSASIYSSTFVAASGSISSDPDNESIVIGARVHDPWQNGTILVDVDNTVEISWTTIKSGFIRENKTYIGQVSAVLEEIGSFSLGGPSDLGVYIPISQAQSFFETDEVDMIIVQLKNSDETTIEDVSAAIKDAFDDQISVTSSTAVLSTISSVFSFIETLLTGIAGISLLVAGIGIMNIMIVSLMERTREIGVLKALGIRGRTVLLIFLGESMIIGILGAAIGIVLGWSLAHVVGRLGLLGGIIGPPGTAGTAGLTITPVLTSIVFLGALVFGVGVSVIFALYPAWRASKLKPVEALRYE